MPQHACPSCGHRGAHERLDYGWVVCGLCWIAYRIGDTGKVVAWAPTNKSHPALRSRR